MIPDEIVDLSYGKYLQATQRLAVVPIDRKDYRGFLITAAVALKDCPESNEEHPYVFIKVGDVYMKAKKIGESLELSYMDKETFKLTVQFKEDTQCHPKNNY